MELPRLPEGDRWNSDFIARLRLWFVSTVFFVLLISLVPVVYFLRRLRLRVPGPDIFYQYLGDVKLYQDFAREDRGELSDIGQPPRVPMRRRMVRALLDAYFADYDRWYLVAHSLGSVLAWNGLMETAHCLPNYLDEETWKKCLSDDKLVVVDPEQGGNVKIMRPPRPIWIEEENHVIDRKVLFSKLRGLVTYGSPLDKFAFMWAPIVPINLDKKVFASNFEWINVLDHHDPVAGKLDAYGAAEEAPKNYAYKAFPVLLVSHIFYLHFRKSQPDCFVRRLVDWTLNDDNTSFTTPTADDPSWDLTTSEFKGAILRGVWWTGALIIAALIVGCVAVELFGGSIFANAVFAVILAAVIVTVSGVLLNINEKHLAHLTAESEVKARDDPR